MLLTITTTIAPATDLGYLLYKHPDRVVRFEQSFGTATVFYPQADPDRCTAALLLDVDAIRLVRSRGKQTPDFSLGQYVNDRPYAASSLFAVALGKVFSTARSGRCGPRQELADIAIPLELNLPAVPCRGGVEVARRLFEPLGWDVAASPVPLHRDFPAWGDSRYLRLQLTGTVRLADALNHLYVLLPVLDDAKHYWIDIAEVDKLVRSGSSWLATHPARNLITRRYLGNRRGLHRVAHARLAELDESGTDALDPSIEEEAGELAMPAEDAGGTEPSGDEVGSAETLPAESETADSGPAETEHRTGPGGPPPDAGVTPVPALAARRIDAVLAGLKQAGAGHVIDLGCGSGKLLSAMVSDPFFTRIAGTDASVRALRLAERRLKLDRMSDRLADRIRLFQGALTYEDARFGGYDAAVLMEVIEHVDAARLPALEKVVFGAARPATVIVTTPNVEYNSVYGMPEGSVRHPDHRFEWDRAQFTDWADTVAGAFGYRVHVDGVGDLHPEAGRPTQIGVFTRD